LRFSEIPDLEYLKSDCEFQTTFSEHFLPSEEIEKDTKQIIFWAMVKS